MNGMWGHCAALPDGHSEGYGGMNQIGLPMTISLVLARQAGVNDPALDRAIERSVRLLRWYVNKGAIPYGDHLPWPSHDDNGKCSVRGRDVRPAGRSRGDVVLRPHGHRGLRRAGTRSLRQSLEYAVGAARRIPRRSAGHGRLPEGTRVGTMNLARNWKGGFVYQKIEPGDENDNYTHWDLTGAYLLSYGLPLKSLYVTGKKPSVVPPLKAERGQGGHCRRARLLSLQRRERL